MRIGLCLALFLAFTLGACSMVVGPDVDMEPVDMESAQPDARVQPKRPLTAAPYIEDVLTPVDMSARD
jgi:hypothetical protein